MKIFLLSAALLFPIAIEAPVFAAVVSESNSFEQAKSRNKETDSDSASETDSFPEFFFYQERAEEKWAAGDIEGAIEDISIAIEFQTGLSILYELRSSYHYALGNDLEAINDISKAIEIDPEIGLLYKKRGDIKLYSGDTIGAIEDYELLLEYGDNREKFTALDFLIKNYSSIYSFDFKKLSALNSNLIEISESIKRESSNSFDLANILYYQAILSTFKGDWSKTIDLLEESIEIFDSIGAERHILYTEAKDLLIPSLLNTGEIDEARKLINERTLQGQMSLAYIGFLENDLEEVERILERIYNLSSMDKGRDKDPYLLETLGLAYWWQNKNAEAKPLIEEAVAIYEESYGPSSPELINPLKNLAMVYFKDEDYENTDLYLRRSLSIQFTYLRESLPYLPSSQRKLFLDNLGITYDAIFSASSIHPKGADLALFARLNRHGILEEIEKIQSQLSSVSDSNQALIDRITRLNSIISSSISTEISKEELTRLKFEKDLLQLNLFQLLPDIKPAVYSTNDIANLIPEKGLLIEFQKYRPFNFNKPTDALRIDDWQEAKYLALILSPDGEVTGVELGLASPIEEKIKEALTASEQGLPIAQQLWFEVGDLIIKPIAQATSDSEVWFISPDAELNRVPFAALSGPKNNQLLGELIDIRLLTTGRELLDLATRSTTTSQDSLVVANPNFDLNTSSSLDISANASQQRSGDLSSVTWRALPGTDKEGFSISNLIKAQLLTQEDASVLAIQDRNSPNILHIASHSFFLPDEKREATSLASVIGSGPFSPPSQNETPLLRSGIVLAGANEPNASDLDDGLLTALEVLNLDLKGTELVVISGCESGRGQIQSGEGVYGLKRAIAVAGSRSSLLSLWKVNDAATAAFMESFYKRLIAGEGRAEALAATQKEFRNHPTNQDWRHPYVWAAFQLSGDWKPIAF